MLKLTSGSESQQRFPNEPMPSEGKARTSEKQGYNNISSSIGATTNCKKNQSKRFSTGLVAKDVMTLRAQHSL